MIFTPTLSYLSCAKPSRNWRLGAPSKPNNQVRRTKIRTTTEVPTNPTPDDLDAAIREHILERARKYNAEIVKSFSIAAEDLSNNKHRAALGALDGIDSMLQEFRALLRLIE